MKTANKPERKEASYPYYDLESSIKFAVHIKDLGGSKGGVRKSLLAKQTGQAESTPSFFQRLSACKVFGIIEGWGAYGLTELGRKYFYPQSENSRQEALLEMLTSPEPFRLIVDKFDGEKLPATSIAGNILHQELGISDSWKDRVAQTFVRSAQFCGIIDTGGCLRYRAAVHTSIPDADQVEPQTVKQSGPIGQFVNPKPIGQQPDVLATGPIKYRRTELYLPLEGGEVVSIPRMTEDDFNLLMETLKLWKSRLIKDDSAKTSPEQRGST